MGLVSVGLVIDTAGAQVANWAMCAEMTEQNVHWVRLAPSFIQSVRQIFHQKLVALANVIAAERKVLPQVDCSG